MQRYSTDKQNHLGSQCRLSHSTPLPSVLLRVTLTKRRCSHADALGRAEQLAKLLRHSEQLPDATSLCSILTWK
nr:hypothetical protein CFP56_09527 [Quercus suber]